MFSRLRFRAASETGQGLVELIVAITILAVAIGALLTVSTSSAVSLQRSDQKGTALMLAEKQIELYRNLSYNGIRLDQASLSAIASSDVYRNHTDPTIPAGTVASSVVDTAPAMPCANPPTTPPECAPVQANVTGPDHRKYRIDTYITPTTGSSTIDSIKQVTVIVRNAQVSTLPILARNTSTFSPVNNASAKAQVGLVLSALANATTGDNVDPTATLDGGSSPSGTINFFVVGPQSSAPSTCVGGAWQLIGAATVADNGSYQSGGFTVTSVGTYWWYASYSGDGGNNAVNSGCTSTMAHTVVHAAPITPPMTLTAPSTGNAGSALALNVSFGSETPTGTVNFFVATGTSPSCPGGGGWSPAGSASITGSSATVNYTPASAGTYYWYASYGGDPAYNPTNTCSGVKSTTVAPPPDTYSFSAIPGQTAGASFTFTLTANLGGGGGADLAYNGTKCISFSGLSASPGGTPATFPAQGSCGAGQSAILFSNGLSGSISATAFNAASSSITATAGLVTGSSANFNVAPGAAAGMVLVGITTDTTPAVSCSGTLGNVSCSSTNEPNNSGFTLVSSLLLKDQWSNNATVTGSAVTIDLVVSMDLGSVSPSALTVPVGQSQTSGPFTLNRKSGNKNTTVLTATIHNTTKKLTVTLSS
jgi:type II secretory pathway pseudopilin PulG